MRLVAIVIGAVLLMAAVRWDSGGNQLWPLLKNDYEQGFVKWFLAVVLIGAIGYVPELRGVSTLLLAIIILDLLFQAIHKNPDLLSGAVQAVSAPAKAS